MGEWTIQEQTVNDAVTGLVLRFVVLDDGLPRLRILGASLPLGNREIGFGTDGIEAFSGTYTGGDDEAAA